MKLIFVGGIHGVGKTTICEEASSALKIQHKSASTLIKERKQINDQSKIVEQLDDNQSLLIKAIEAYRSVNSNLLLDGHFSLLVADNKVEKIPVDVFKAINPSAIVLIVDDPTKIVERLKSRDRKDYSLPLISEFQDIEISHASDIAKALRVPFITCNATSGILGIKDSLERLNA